MSKHTPAPWTVGDSGGYLNQLKINPTIGVVYGAGEEIQANAYLVAASPDMYEALLICRSTLEASGAKRKLAIVDAAIAKAGGELND